MARQVVIMDSTQLSTFFECEQKNDYEHTQSLVQINHANPALTFQVPDKIAAGSLGHKYLEIYYKILGTTQDPAEAARIALEFDPDKADKIDPEFPLSAELRQKVRNRFIDYLGFYSRDYTVAIKSKHTIGVKNGMLADIAVPEPLVEQGFSYGLLDTAEYLFVLEGRLDFIGHTHGELLWMDHKWQLRQRDLYPKSIQFRNYCLATGLSLGVINYIRLHDKQSKTTFVRDTVSFSPAEMYAWKQELIEMFIHVAKVQASGEFALNRSACPGKFGYPCNYTSLCDTYNPRERAALKARDFTKGREWKPW